MIKVIVAGGREFSDYALLSSKLDKILSNQNQVTVICGGASGADALGELYARKSGHSVEYHHAKWKLHGNSAGPIRNKLMASVADACVVFWDGASTGSLSMIREAKRAGIPLRIIRY